MCFKSCLRVVLAAALLALPIVNSASASDSLAQMHSQMHSQMSLMAHTIKMKTTEIDTSGSNLSIFSAGQLSPGSHFYIVQFSGPVQESWKKRISELGVEFHGYLPDDSFIVKMDASTAAQVSADPDVTWVGPYRPEFKLAPKSRQPGTATGAATETGQKQYTVKVFDGEDLRPVIDSLKAQGATVSVVADHDGLNGKLLRVQMDDILAQEAAKMDEVEWMEEYVPPRPLNDVAAGIILNGTQSIPGDPPAYPLSLTGTGQVVGIMDTGLDSGTIPTTHPAFQGNAGNGGPKILSHFSYDPSRNGAWSDPDGHGTHTAGSLTGEPFTANGVTYNISGIAHDAQLVVQSVYEPESPQYLYITDLNSQFLDAYNSGAKIHSDSWGGSNPGEYDTRAHSADTFIWEHPDFVACFAAGNGGIDKNGDGVIDPDSVISPGTAKDVITVGATENYRTNISSTYNIFGFSNPPFSSDPIANNINGMAAFSSRGPTADGRVKPDVAAPGTAIISTKSTVTPLTGSYWETPSQIGYSSSYDQYFAVDNGTSMATPLAAGAAALVRQYYTDVQHISPSAALIKATLIGGAYNMAPGQYGTGATQEIKNPPDNSQGWGRVDVANSINPPAPEKILFADYTSGVSTGQTRLYSYNVTDTTVPVKITLVWSDYPGAPEAAKELVNDLDLTVTGPDGSVYHGNQFGSGGFSTPGATAYDNTNNVEVVEFSPSTTGTFEVDVDGANVPDGPQPFALVVEGGGLIQVLCDFSLAPSSAQYQYKGGTGSFDVNSSGTCSWTPVSDSSWITITSPGTFFANGSVNYSVSPNPALVQRTGRILAGGQTFQVTQAATPVNFSMLPMQQEGQAVTLKAAFSLGDTPIVNERITFYDQNTKRGTVRTDSSGIATIRFKAAIGTHLAYAASPQITVPAVGTVQAQNTDASPLAYTIARVVPVSPANGAVVEILPVTLSWDTSTYPDATDYEVQVNSNPTFPASLSSFITANPAVYTSTMLPGAVKFWRVRAVLPDGHSLYSKVSKFKYKPVPVLGLSIAPYSAAKVSLTAKITDGSGNGIGGRKVYFFDNDVMKGYAITKPDGTAMKRVAAISGATVQIKFNGDSKYSAAVPVSTTLP